MRRLTIPIVAAAFSLGMPAFAQVSSEDWDINQDGILADEEFAEGLHQGRTFEAIDEDSDGRLSEDELRVWLFDAYDTDNSGIIEGWERGDLKDDRADGALLGG
jgi:hypothetical protein